jgi:hypothetical protein
MVEGAARGEYQDRLEFSAYVESDIVMAGHSRPKDGVASLAYVPAIHVLLAAIKKDVDARHKAGHDDPETKLQARVLRLRQRGRGGRNSAALEFCKAQGRSR